MNLRRLNPVDRNGAPKWAFTEVLTAPAAAGGDWRFTFAAFAASVTLGCAVARGPTTAFVVASLFCLPFLLALPSAAWIAAAVIVAVAFRGFIGLGLLPGYAQFLHILLAWGALGIALLQPRARTPMALRTAKWLFLLAGAVTASALVNHPEPLRGPIYFALVAEPFAIVLALVADPPSAAWRHRLIRLCALLVAVQVPLAYWQATTLSWGDAVQGTLYGSGAGAHVVGAIVAVGVLWYVAHTRSLASPLVLAVIASMMGVILIADAKQVAFALPVALLAQQRISGRVLFGAAAAFACLLVLVNVRTFNQGYAVPYVDRALSGHSGKEAVARSLLRDATNDGGVLLVGRGPAETVSRAAFETVPAFQKEGSGLGALSLHPAIGPIDKTVVAARATDQPVTANPSLDSFDSAESSGLGLFGDLGLLGSAAYLTLAGVVFAELRRRRSPEAFAAAGGFAMALLLGFVLDWWEEPPFTVFVGVLAGLALAETGEDSDLDA